MAAAAGYIAEDGRMGAKFLDPASARLTEAADLLRGYSSGLAELPGHAAHALVPGQCRAGLSRRCRPGLAARAPVGDPVVVALPFRLIAVPHRRHGGPARSNTQCCSPRRSEPVVAWVHRPLFAASSRCASRTSAGRSGTSPTGLHGLTPRRNSVSLL